MADRKTRHVIADQRGGRNRYEPEWAIDDTECVDAVNVDWFKSTCGRKRGGLSSQSSRFIAPPDIVGRISSLFRRVNAAKENNTTLVVVDDAATPLLWTGNSVMTQLTVVDNPTGKGWEFTAVGVNDLLFLAFKTAVDRLHVIDPFVRRTGLAAPGANTLANQGAGAYPAVARYYRIRWTTQVGGITIRRSEPSAINGITPSGAGASVRITAPALPGEGETHWELEASTDSVTFYRIATIVVATTFYDDAALVGTYNLSPLSQLTGTYTLQKSYKFIAGDQNRLLGYGSWVTTDKQCRIEFSAVVGSLDVGDAERVDTTVGWYVDLDEKDNSEPTGIAGPVLGSYFAFKFRQVYQLTATGNVDKPFNVAALTKGEGSIGAVRHQAIVIGADAIGNPALYWMSHVGPYRWSAGGLEYLGHGIEDLIVGPTETMNLATTGVIAHTCYYPDKKQVWFWWATGTATDPNQLGIFDIMSNGWSRVPTGDLLANTRCSCLYGLATTDLQHLKPFVGLTVAIQRLSIADTGTTDEGTTYQAYILTKAVEPGGPGTVGEVGETLLLAKAASGVTLTDTVTGDFGAPGQTATGTALLTPLGSETRVQPTLIGTGLSEVMFVQHQIGDAAATDNSWSLDRIVIPLGKHQAASG